jgi:hypothetical protein
MKKYIEYVDMAGKYVKKIIISCSVVILIAMFLVIKYYIPQFETKEFIEKEVDRIKVEGIGGNVVGLNAWGNSIRYGKYDGEEVILCVVRSAGRDGKFDTADDIDAQRTVVK